MKPQYEPRTVAQILGYLVEECGEVLSAVGKTQRWGVDSYNPELPEADRESNQQWVLRELEDLMGAVIRAQVTLSVPLPVLLERIAAEHK